MLILIDIISLALIVVGAILLHKSQCDSGFGLVIPGVLCFFISFAVTLACLGSIISAEKSCPQQIQMYEEENKKIETQISEAVQVYLAHESEVYSNIKLPNDSLVSIVAAIPELNSSQLISKQIEILESNNEKIKELKDKVAQLSASKWWLYFGG